MNKDLLFQFIIRELKKSYEDEYLIEVTTLLYNKLYPSFISNFEHMKPNVFVELIVLLHSFSHQFKSLMNNTPVTTDQRVLDWYSCLVEECKKENFLDIYGNNEKEVN